MTATDPWTATYAAVANLPAVWRWPEANRLRDEQRAEAEADNEGDD